MAKKIKYGKIDLPDSDFKDENAMVQLNMMIPLLLKKDLKRLSLTEEYGGQYQVMIRNILTEWVSKQGSKKKQSA